MMGTMDVPMGCTAVAMVVTPLACDEVFKEQVVLMIPQDKIELFIKLIRK